MKIDAGQHVVCLLRNSVVAEGIVQAWSEQECTLLSMDNKSIIIIPNPSQELVMVKIILNDSPIPAAPKPQVVEKIKETQKEFNQVLEEPLSDLKHKKLAQLKSLLITEEKKEIAEKLRSHHLVETKEVKYGVPGFLTQQKSK